MKIQDKRLKTVLFEALHAGDTFLFNGSVYVKTFWGGSHFGTNLKTGNGCTFADVLVEPVANVTLVLDV